MRTSTLFGVKKLRIFQNLWCVHTDNGGFEPERRFCEQGGGRGQFFAILCGRAL